MSTKRFHYNPKTGKVGECEANIRCRFRLPEESHFATPQEAEAAYGRTQQIFSGSGGSRSGVSMRRILGRGSEKFPDIPREILTQLGSFLDERKERTLLVVPSGSMLYNTQIPWKPTHDYDFITFTEPTGNSMKQHMHGELDVLLVPVDKVADASVSSTQVSEAMYALKHGHTLYQDESTSGWVSYLRGLRVPPPQYYKLLERTKRSFRQRYIEPVEESTEEFRPFKHTLRYDIMSARKRGDAILDPGLSEEERKIYLSALKTGRNPYSLDS